MSSSARITESPTTVDADAASDAGVLAQLKQSTEQFIVDLWRQWYSFWFTPEDPLTLGIIRILTGWMLIYNLLVWGSDLHAFFGTNGLQPLDAILDFHQNDPVFSFLYYVPDSWLTTVHWLCVGVAFAFFLGIGTRVTSIAAYLISISYSQRVPVANFGLDQILGLLLLYLAIGPSGACLSVDAWFRKRRSRANGGTLVVPNLASARVALRLIQLHLCVIYFWAGFAKLKGDSWWTGEAMWQVMANMEYQTLDLTWMAWVPWLPYLLAHVTVAWEVFFCVLIWNRKLRPILLAIGTGMHFGIGAFLGMWTFGLVMTYAYFSFSDPAAWRCRFAKLRRRPAMEPALADDVISDAVAELQPTMAEKHRKPATRRRKPVPANAPANMPANAPSQVPIAQPVAASHKPDKTDVAPRTDSGSVHEVRKGRSKTPAVAPDRSSSSRVKSASDAKPSRILPIVPELSVTSPDGIDAEKDSSADQWLPNEEAALLLVSLHPDERRTLRNYFRKHDIPCRAVTTPESALSLVISLMPAAIVVSGSRMTPKQIAGLLDDLNDISDAPIVAVLSPSQHQILEEEELPAQIIIYPASPRQIREEIGRVMFGEPVHEPVDAVKPPLTSRPRDTRSL